MSEGTTQPPTQWAAPLPPPSQPGPIGQERPRHEPPAPRGSRAPWIATAVLAAAVAALGVLYLGERSTSSDLRDRVGELAAATTTTAAEGDEAADEGDLPDLKAVADGVPGGLDVDITGGSSSVTIDIRSPSTRSLNWLKNYMNRLNMPGDAIVARMEQTRALDGTLQEEAAGVRVTWTYHPDDGLSAVFSLDS